MFLYAIAKFTVVGRVDRILMVYLVRLQSEGSGIPFLYTRFEIMRCTARMARIGEPNNE